MNETESIIYNYVLQNASLLYFVFNEEGVVVEANEFARKTFGENVLSLNVTEIFLDLSGQGNIPSLIQAGTTRQLMSVSTVYGEPESFIFSFYASSKGTVAMGEYDYRELEHLRKSLLDANNELNNLVRELHKANVEMKKLNDIKNEFLGMAAHDLRNPIGNIFTISNILLVDTAHMLPEQHVEFLDNIRMLSEFMLSLLENLLDITAIESGKLQLMLKQVNLVELIEQSIKLGRIMAERKNISLMFNPPQHEVSLVVDDHKILQVLDNLVSNAVKYSFPQSEIVIQLFETNETVTVAIKDQGVGIPEKELQKLFKPFSRTNAKATGGEKSTGLGLAIVRQIIRAHQGTVWVESEVGEGSTFSFCIPRKTSLT